MNNRWNRRKTLVLWLVIAVVFLAAVCIGGLFCEDAARATDFSRKNIAPCLKYPFGTDWLGRDMFARTVRGLSISIIIGVCAATFSAVMAFILGVVSATMGKTADTIVTWIIDLVMGIPHMLLLILICVACGRGLKGVILGVALTHWTSLARLIRGEVLQLKEQIYIKTARKLGKSNLYIAMKHMAPHLLPQFIVGLVLLFPHAILHESGITFLWVRAVKRAACNWNYFVRSNEISDHRQMVACTVSGNHAGDYRCMFLYNRRKPSQTAGSGKCTRIGD